MPWYEVHPLDQRIELIQAHATDIFSVAELSERLGISRKTANKWIHRYAVCGVSGLAETSRAPHSCPHQTPFCIERALIGLRRRHRHWGPRKLLVVLAREYPLMAERLPVAGIAGEMLKRAGLVERRRPAFDVILEPGEESTGCL